MSRNGDLLSESHGLWLRFSAEWTIRYNVQLSMKFWVSAYGLLIASFLLIGREWGLLPQGDLRVVLLDVGQGDAILITTPGRQQVLVDGGPDLTVLERLGEEMPFFDRRIELMILSHTDADHVTGLIEVLRRYAVEKVLMTGVARETAIYQAFLDAVRESGAEVIIAEAKNDLDLGGGVILDVLWPEASLFGQEMKEPNNASIVVKLVWKEHDPTSPFGLRGASVLFTGDIEEEVEEQLLIAGMNLDADVLKVPHHGSKTSSSEAFLLAIDPELALISVGKDNRYGHPHPAVLARYAALGIPVRRTDEEGPAFASCEAGSCIRATAGKRVEVVFE